VTRERRGTYLPFGAGNRKCIGDAFALTEAQVVVATIAQNWQFSHVPDAPATHPRVRMTLRPDQLTMLPSRRKPTRTMRQ
jgi:pentalenene oxygenase